MTWHFHDGEKVNCGFLSCDVISDGLPVSLWNAGNHLEDDMASQPKDHNPQSLFNGTSRRLTFKHILYLLLLYDHVTLVQHSNVPKTICDDDRKESLRLWQHKNYVTQNIPWWKFIWWLNEDGPTTCVIILYFNSIFFFHIAINIYFFCFSSPICQ